MCETAACSVRKERGLRRSRQRRGKWRPVSRGTHHCSPSLRHGDPDRQTQAWRETSSVCTSGTSDASLAPRPLLRQPPGPYLLLQPHQTYAHGCARAHTLSHTHRHTWQASHPQTQLSLSRSLCSLDRGSAAPEFGLPIPGLTWSHPFSHPGRAAPWGQP